MILVIKDTNAVRTHHAIVHMSGSFSAVVFLSARKESVSASYPNWPDARRTIYRNRI